MFHGGGGRGEKKDSEETKATAFVLAERPVARNLREEIESRAVIDPLPIPHSIQWGGHPASGEGVGEAERVDKRRTRGAMFTSQR